MRFTEFADSSTLAQTIGVRRSPSRVRLLADSLYDSRGKGGSEADLTAKSCTCVGPQTLDMHGGPGRAAIGTRDHNLRQTDFTRLLIYLRRRVSQPVPSDDSLDSDSRCQRSATAWSHYVVHGIGWIWEPGILNGTRKSGTEISSSIRINFRRTCAGVPGLSGMRGLVVRPLPPTHG